MKKLKSIKKGLISRNMALAKLAFGAGKDLLKSSDSDLVQNALGMLEKRSGEIGHELSLMKGSVMKAGQALSVFLGDYLPDSVIKTFAALESQSYFLEWDTIKKQIPSLWLEALEFDPEPIAAASIGQVHKATIKKTGEKIAVKIQYPGVKKAVGRDVAAIKLLVSSLKVVPKTLDLSPVYEEVKEMLYQEMDYTQELAYIKTFSKLCEGLDRVKVITPVDEYCSPTILSTKLESGIPLRDFDVGSVTQEERNTLGAIFLDLFYRELFEWGRVQTDAHFGNYLLETKSGKTSWVLLDFGATKVLEGEFMTNYQNVIKSTALGDRELFFESFQNIAKLKNFESFDKDLMWEYLELMGSPFKSGEYDWGKSDIPEKAMAFAPKLMKLAPQGVAAKETVFVDRKVASVFYVLKKLECVFDPRELLLERLKTLDRLKDL